MSSVNTPLKARGRKGDGKANFLNAIYFKQGLTCTIGLTNDLIDGGQPRAKNGF